MTKTFSRLAMIGAALASFASAAQAEDAAEFRVSIQAEDLNLASPTGRATLAGRIDAAADRMCRYNGTVSVREMASSQACREEFEKNAQQQVKRLAGMNGRGAAFAAASH